MLTGKRIICFSKKIGYNFYTMQSKILDKIKLPIRDLKELQGDFKKLGKKQFQKLKNSIEKNGFIQPFFVWLNKGTYWILDGHQRKKAIIDLYGDVEVDCLTIQAKSMQEAKKLCIFYSSSYAEFDKESLLQFAEGLNFGDIEDFQFPTFNLSEGDFLAEPDEKDDHIPEVAQNECGVELGDIYTLGNHRLMCGDSTDKETVEKLMGGQKADMIFTDPPYGVNYEGGHFHSGDVNVKRKREKLKNDNSDQIYSDVIPILAQFVDGPCYTWFADTKPLKLFQAVDDIGEIHAVIIWHKINAKYAAMNAQYKQRHEPCLYWKPKSSNLRWQGASNECTVWEEARDGQNKYHPTQKPTVLAERAIRNHSAKTVLDLFGGSGSTLIACEKTKRKCYMMELDPHYCSVIIKRWEEFTGKKAVKNA